MLFNPGLANNPVFYGASISRFSFREKAWLWQ